jgi:DNA helicase-2/ATP-dependent DNA helicase PcrA
VSAVSGPAGTVGVWTQEEALRADALLALVDDEQRAAVLAPAGPLLIVAGAGTGKTRTLTCRVAHRVATGQVPGGSVLAVTHSGRAAGEMRDRFTRMSVDGLELVAARTIHAAALRQLRFFWDRTGRPGELRIADNLFGLAREALAAAGVRDADSSLVTDLLAEIEWAKGQLVGPDAYPQIAAEQRRGAGSLSAERTATAYNAYQYGLDRQQALDFTDLLTEAAALIDTQPDVAAQIHSRYRTLVVDEYQDTDPAQQRLLRAWLGPGRDVTVVGDPRQSIYRFKGADPALMGTFLTSFPDAQVVTLTRNYRSSPQVLTVANSLAAAATGQADGAVRPRTKAGRAAWDVAHPAALVAARPDGPTATARRCPSEADEARWVAAQAAAQVRAGTPPEQIAVLVRFNSQTGPFEHALAVAGVPYRVADADRFFDRPEVVGAVEEVRRRLLLAGTRGATFSPDELDGGGSDLLTGAELLREVLADSGWDAASPPERMGALRERWENFAALVAMVEQLPAGDLLGAVDMLGELDARRELSSHVAASAVTVATVHKAKGLEWDVVFCPRWNEGSLPSVFARSRDELTEEACLAYVAVTRARRVLCMSYADVREDGREQTPSRFLREAGFTVDDGAVSAAATAKPKRTRGATRTHRCKRCAVPLVDPSLRTLGVCVNHLSGEVGRRWLTLRQWRTQTSVIEQREPFRVLQDATLLAVALSCPADLASLAEVKGIGPSKVERYGITLLSLVR